MPYTDMGAVAQTPNPNYTPVPIQHDLLVTHMHEGGSAGSEAWLAQRKHTASLG